MLAGKKISQSDLRKAMMDHKKKQSGQRICIICKVPVRNEAAWIAHLKSHKNNVASPMEVSEIAVEPQISLKRSHSLSRPAKPSKKIKGILKNADQSSLPSDFFDSPSEQSKISLGSIDKQIEKLTVKADNATNGKETEQGEAQKISEVEGGPAATLPPGFFDDPILDAKVRHVEYKDPVEEEWDKFQKEIQEEAAQSAQIIDEDEEEAATKRQLDDIEEQMWHWSRVMALVKRKEQLQAEFKKKEEVFFEEMSCSDDDGDFDEFIDWRQKESYK